MFPECAGGKELIAMKNESDDRPPAAPVDDSTRDDGSDELRALVARCLLAAQANDDEEAHIAEDRLRRRALELIAGGHPDPIAIAGIALATEALDFQRWYS